MTAQIRPNRMEVNDRFPMLGFAIRSDSPGVDAEVVLASDIALFRPENRAQRTAANFYSSREHGMLAMPRGEGIFSVPSDVLARLIGNDRVFFGLATGKAGNGGLTIDALPRDGSPYVSLRGFTGRTLRRSYGSGRANTPPVLEWSGDSARPGTEPVAAMPVSTLSPAANGGLAASSPVNSAAPIPYDDGFGPIPVVPGNVSNAKSMTIEPEIDDGFDFPQASMAIRDIPVPIQTEATDTPSNRNTPSSAMVFDQADFDKVDRWAGRYADLFTWQPPAPVVNEINSRGFAVQPLYRAVGDTNLDFYKVAISQFPPGWNSASFLEHFIQNINSFIDTDRTEFSPYDQSDTARLASADKVGTVFKLDIEGPDNAAVVISTRQTLREGQFYAVTTIHTPWSGDHPVSGHRQFGFYEQDGIVAFYTRGADRSTNPFPGTEWLMWRRAHGLWQSFQQKVAAFINNNGGRASIVRPFSERFNSSAIELRFGDFDAPQAAGMAFSDDGAIAEKAIVMPALPGDSRGRAGRIGGEFATRIGEALDLGLAETALTPLLDKLDPPAAAIPLAPGGAMSTYASAQSLQWSINWDDADLVAQPTPNGCWATTLAMLIGWFNRQSVSPESIAQRCGHDINYVLPWAERETVATTLGLTPVHPQCYTPEGFRALIENHGPLYVGKMATAGGSATTTHAVLVVGMYSDGSNHFVRIHDASDRAVGSPGQPGGYSGAHRTGTRYIMRYENFQNEYEMAARGNPAYVQIIYAGVPLGRTPNRSISTPPSGFAMQYAATQSEQSPATEEDAARTGPGTVNLAPPPEPVARGMDAGAIATIAGVALQQVISNSGDVSWTTDQFRGIKHPNDTAPANPGPFQDATPISLNWPVLSDSYIDDISAFFRIDWQHNGKSIGNVRITNNGTNDAIGWSLAVRGTIMDDNRLHPPHDCAGLRITLHYHFTHVVGSDQIAMCDIEVFGDGTHTKNCRWIQSSLFAAEQARSMVAA